MFDPISLPVLLRLPRFAFALVSTIVVVTSIQFMAPSVAPYLHHIGFSPGYIAVYFAIPAILYAAGSLSIYLLTDRMQRRLVIFMGLLLESFGMYLLGTPSDLGKNSQVVMLLGAAFVGASAGMVSIPAIPEMLDAIDAVEELNLNPEELENYISGVFVICNGIGEALGPVLSSCLNEAYGFRAAQSIYAGLLLLYGLAYFVGVGHFAIFSAPTQTTPGGPPKGPGSYVEQIDEIHE